MFVHDIHLNMRDVVDKLIKASLEAVDAEKCTTSLLQKKKFFDKSTSIDVIAVGKAAIPMLNAVIGEYSSKITGGIVVTKAGCATKIAGHHKNIKVWEAAHPVPDLTSHLAGKEVMDFIQSSKADTIVFLISGGGSALITNPQEDITLHDVQNITRLLIQCGASINELNIIRKHIDQVKGGGLTKLIAKNQRVYTLVLSDVVGDRISTVASGPTVPDESTFEEALGVLRKYQLIRMAPKRIVNYLKRGAQGEIPETLKPHDEICRQVQHSLVGCLGDAALAAKKMAHSLGIHAQIHSISIEGEARAIGKQCAVLATEALNNRDSLPKPACIILGGETTVIQRGGGEGGRCQELVLSALRKLGDCKDLCLAAFTTDGTDGGTDAAGAFIDEQIALDIQKEKLNIKSYLDENNTYPFFKKLKGHIKTGPTNTGVNDLIFLLIQ